jgi:hypothetical protein
MSYSCFSTMDFVMYRETRNNILHQLDIKYNNFTFVLFRKIPLQVELRANMLLNDLTKITNFTIDYGVTFFVFIYSKLTYLCVPVNSN